MAYYRLNDQYLIKTLHDTIVWIEILDSADNLPLIIEGECTVDDHKGILFLSGWKDTYPQNESIDLKNIGCWDKTNYYAVLSDSGNMKIYSTSSGDEIVGDEFKQLASSIGCTMKYK